MGPLEMPIPELNDDGILPEGIHDCTLEEIGESFGQFQRTMRRIVLFERFESLVAEIRSTGLIVAIVVDGSYVTSKDAPSDIDLVLVLAASHDFAAELRPFEYNVLSRRRVRTRYQFDILVARERSSEYDEYVRYFQQVRGQPGLQKGVLRIVP